MRKIIWLLLVILIASTVYADLTLPLCEDTREIASNCTMVTPNLKCPTYNYSIINITDESIIEEDALNLIVLDVYYFNFTQPEGEYVVELCDYTTRQVRVTDEDTGKMILAIIILLPMILGGFLLWGASTLDGEKHPALKIFLFLLSMITFFVSMHFGLLNLIKFYNFPELQNIMGSTVYWIGLIIGVIVVYFIIYLFALLIHEAAQKRQERLTY